ncbi:membrane protein PM19L isoform X2 [Aristolochia californica]|uniref:membrane protein PM19L isoform X2 n=1 Tax=Aristolochia californica TaxID=171875 RepID=UPI0035D6F5CA
MAAEGPKSLAFFLLALNLVLYIIVVAIAGWAIKVGIEETSESAAAGMIFPARLFPIYSPIGNFATGFFVIFSLIAGAAGVASSISGIHNVLQWNASNLFSAAAYSTTTWALTLLAMGLACKEINIGERPTSLRTLEALTFILSGTQLFCLGAVNVGVMEVYRI